LANRLTHVDEAGARERAEWAWNRVGVEVRAAADEAAAILRESKDPAARSIAWRTLGLAAVELEDTHTAHAHMVRAGEEARRLNDPVLLAQAETGLAASYQYLGEHTAALRLARRAVRRAPDHARVRLALGVILERFGRVNEALAVYDQTERLAEQDHDLDTLVRAWCNRGVLLIYQADFAGAHADLRRARDLAQSSGQEHLHGAILANLAYLDAQRGALVEALAQMEATGPKLRRVGDFRFGVHELDRCEVLMLAGLSGDAMLAGAEAVSAFERAGAVVEAAEARMAVVHAALAVGDTERAYAAAVSAKRVLARRRSGAWSALAQQAMVLVVASSGTRSVALARDAARVAEQLQAAGWSSSAASARILAARIELSLGRRAQAEAQLRLVRETPRSPVALRIQARCATALLRREAGDRRGARAALRSGWALLERHRATLGATELRAGASAHVAELVAIGLEMAIEDRRPREVLLWAERGRVGALTPRATAPPEDPELAALLGELRVVAAEADATAKRGENNRALLRRQAQVEERVRSRARLLPPEEAGGEPPTVAAADLLAALGDRALVQYVVSGGDLWAVIAAGGRSTLRRICTEAQISDEVDGLRVALRRLAFGSPVPQLQQAARNGALYARDRLAELLFDPIADLLGERPRVIVPMGVLHAVPWSALANPSVEQVVAPSASLWARAARGASSPSSAARGRTILVAGPRLVEADAEIAAIRALRPGAEEFGGTDATVDAVREAMAGASLAHLACHGTFRADNPLFSSLELHDGALSVFELERLGRSPQQIVLSACDAGLSAVHPGDELLGLAAALLRLGTTGLVASVLPVPDAATRRLMEALHAELAAGATLAQALAAASATLDPERDDDLVASWAFQLLGAG
jgi:Tfp pilus assembly protein PilF